jgi:hypothetical protein
MILLAKMTSKGHPKVLWDLRPALGSTRSGRY